jgi:hypothetical protein
LPRKVPVSITFLKLDFSKTLFRISCLVYCPLNEFFENKDNCKCSILILLKCLIKKNIL